ncbi:hypothetical protein [Kitasatospora kifunensis]|uniref:Putative membrane protein n=1 Tax=Kitasatospora kifunensis TaxID=58351 RepID=A0A7W7R3G4_KITKI|nr:hypothetical protein [Kitasatospora kifunensis]MBB4924783.1 putative membrane protein [Kitasatospora kifunensis]
MTNLVITIGLITVAAVLFRTRLTSSLTSSLFLATAVYGLSCFSVHFGH